MYKPKTIFAQHAFNVVSTYVKTKDISALKKQEPPKEFQIKRACFVTLHNLDGSLRGCIGTLEPQFKNLWLEIISNGVAACSRDSRFPPVLPDELENIEISVDVLSEPEKVKDFDILNPKKYGIIVTDGLRRGVLLPDIDGIDTLEQQIDIAKRKAGLSFKNNDELEFYSFTATRYH
ncbi:MAG: AmmeMemoRadiSam system protein A [Bacteroidales bacterium]|nr:AmmeMemoRadiSam system protein A [Bacteroidales bacterium]